MSATRLTWVKVGRLHYHSREPHASRFDLFFARHSGKWVVVDADRGLVKRFTEVGAAIAWCEAAAGQQTTEAA